MRISDWSSDVCASDLVAIGRALLKHPCLLILHDATASLDSASRAMLFDTVLEHTEGRGLVWVADQVPKPERFDRIVLFQGGASSGREATSRSRSEEHTSELQSLMSSAHLVCSLKTKQQYS